MSHTILIVEDDQEIKTFLEEMLRENLYVVYSTPSGSGALKFIEKIRPDLILLDLNLPDIHGQSICIEVKKLYPQLPILILTASTNTQDLVKSFGNGADDFLSKPFVNAELLARIQVRLAKNSSISSVLTFDSLTLDKKKIEVQIENEPVSLTQTEFRLLEYLMENPNRVLSREQILGKVWAQQPDIETRVVDVYIGYLRNKLKKHSNKKFIHSKRGFGYVLQKKE